MPNRCPPLLLLAAACTFGDRQAAVSDADSTSSSSSSAELDDTSSSSSSAELDDTSSSSTGSAELDDTSSSSSSAELDDTSSSSTGSAELLDFCESCCSAYQGPPECSAAACVCGLELEGTTFPSCCPGGTVWAEGCIAAAIDYCELDCEACT